MSKTEWTVKTLKEYIERIIAERERAVELKEGELERRLDNLNKLREEVKIDREQYLRIDVHEAFYKDYAEWKLATSKQLTETETKSKTWILAIGLFLVAIQIMIAIVFYFIVKH